MTPRLVIGKYSTAIALAWLPAWPMRQFENQGRNGAQTNGGELQRLP
jgi:hypothetical protein